MNIRFHTAARRIPEEVSGLKVDYPPPRRPSPRWRWYLVLLLVSSPLIHFAVTALYSQVVLSAYGTVFLEPYQLRASQSGYVAHINVRTGEHVIAGLPLIALHDPSIEEREQQLSLQLLELEDAAAQHSSALLEAFERQVRNREQMVADQQSRLAAIKALVAQGAATVTEARESAAQLLQAQSELNRAMAELAAEQQRSQSHKRPSLDPEVSRMETELKMLDYRRSALVQRAAQEGDVIELMVREGEFVAEGSPLALIAKDQLPRIMAYLDPKQAYRVRVGDRATVTLSDGTKLDATVEQPPSTLSKLPKDIERQVRYQPMSVLLRLSVDRDWAPESLIYGSPVDVRFHFAWGPRFDDHTPLASR